MALPVLRTGEPERRAGGVSPRRNRKSLEMFDFLRGLAPPDRRGRRLVPKSKQPGADPGGNLGDRGLILPLSLPENRRRDKLVRGRPRLGLQRAPRAPTHPARARARPAARSPPGRASGRKNA